MSGSEKIILDATAGWRQMWNDKNFPFAVFCDIQSDDELEAKHVAYEKQRGHKGNPFCFTNKTKVMDFRKIDFPDETFRLVIFDPPQSTALSPKSALYKKWGALVPETWQHDLKRAAKELWRVLKPYGILIFKWSSTEIPINSVLKLFPTQPLFGQKTARSMSRKFPANTYWFCFMKIPEGEK